MKPTLLQWLVTGLFLAVLIAVVVCRIHHATLHHMVGQVFRCMIALIALYLHADPSTKMRVRYCCGEGEAFLGRCEVRLRAIPLVAQPLKPH